MRLGRASVTDESAVRTYVSRYVRSGFYDSSQIERIVGEDVFDGAVEPARLRSMVEEAFAEKRAEERTWPSVTDCDRLDEVFRSLERAGILTLQNPRLTQSESMAEMSERYFAAGGERSGIRGYCLYDGHDLEHVQESGNLYLTFGDIAGDGPKGAEVGREVKQVLEVAGFTVEWNGSIDTRLLVTGVRWQRRSGGAA
jgi:hypothetical protein